NAVTVPEQGEEASVPAAAPAPPSPPSPVPPAAPVLEREDFSALLRAPLEQPARPAPLLPPEQPSPPPGAPGAPPDGGLVISPATATVLTVVLILLLAVAFGAGLLVGRFYLGGG